MSALNARLPPDVRAVSMEPAPAGFHARYAARSKTYRYRIFNGTVLSPFERSYAWHVRGTVDVDAMDAAVRTLEGRHDFAAFAAAGGSTRTTERTIISSAVHRDGASLLLLDIRGDGFLRHMVRTIAGTLVEIGRGRLAAAQMPEIVASRDRGRAGPTAPARGLFLVAVEYGDL
jgi:tRNA pseudouridine38-40 synthase